MNGAPSTIVWATRQNQDTVSGLYDFLYREYHPVSGRWIQPDPAGLGAADAANPQTWNRYAYVANMPLIAVDLLGLIHCDKSRQECPLDLRGNDLVAIDGMVSERECLIGGGLSSCDLLDPLLTRGFAAACTGQCDRAAFDTRPSA